MHINRASLTGQDIVWDTIFKDLPPPRDRWDTIATKIIVMLYTNVEDVFRQLQKSLYSAAGRLMDSLEAGGHRLILEPPIETYTELLPEFIVVQFERLLRSHSKRIESELRSEWRVKSRLRSPRIPEELIELVIDCLGAGDVDIHH
ncbi:hypothetical protein C8Q75DRAFT_736973 [Abortiporus biennis]|nr:hypothetical protein C8Q75DRAFT_736973 [Abortiporus biennis]